MHNSIIIYTRKELQLKHTDMEYPYPSGSHCTTHKIHIVIGISKPRTKNPGQRLDSALLGEPISDQQQSGCPIVQRAGVGSRDGATFLLAQEGRPQRRELLKVRSERDVIASKLYVLYERKVVCIV